MMARFDLTLLLTWFAILALGTIMVSSTAIALSETYLIKHGVYLLLALAASTFVLFVPLSLWQRCYRLAWAAALLLAVLVLIPGIGVEVNGARRWIRLGSFSIQAAEVAKLLLLVYLAGYLARFAGKMSEQPKMLIMPLVMLVPVCGALLAQPDFGSVVVVGATACAILFVAGARLRHFLVLLAGSVGLIGMLAIVQPYRLERLVSFLDPWSFAYGSGYQLTQALIAFGRGETFGLGLGEGVQKLHYLPEAHNDFIYAVIAEELGLVGALLVLVAFAIVVLRILRCGRQALVKGRAFPGYLCYGVGLLLGIQCLINLGVNTGVLPTKGLTLPFVSFGGNSLIVSCVMIALVLRAQFEGTVNDRA